MMRVSLCYNSDTGRVDTEVEVSGKGYNTDALDDMTARAKAVHLSVMEKAATLWVAAIDAEPAAEPAEDVVTEETKP